MSTIERVPTSVFEGEGDTWAVYRAELSFTGKLYGGSPFDPKLVEGWIKKGLGITNEEQIRQEVKRHLAEVQGLAPEDVTEEAVEKAVEDSTTEKKAQGFKRTPHENRPYVEGRHVKAMIKEATNIAFPMGEHKWGRYTNTKSVQVGGKSPLAVISERVWIPQEPIIVADDSDDFEFAVGHIEDWKGRRSTIGYFEFCERPVITFEVKVVDDFLEHEKWARIWQIAEGNGLGARRSQGGGQFAVTHWERVA